MGRRTKHSAGAADREPAGPALGGGGQGGEHGSGGGQGGAKRGSWLRTHGRDLRFLLIFGFLMGAYYAATSTEYAQERFFPAYLRLNARAGGAILGWAGYDINVADQQIRERRFSVTIGRGCDAVEPSALFVSAVLASPVPLAAKAVAAAGGTVVLMLINLVRIMSLLLTGIYAPKLFDIMHLDIWQALFIFLAILLWALWATGMARRRRRMRVKDASA